MKIMLISVQLLAKAEACTEFGKNSLIGCDDVLLKQVTVNLDSPNLRITFGTTGRQTSDVTHRS